MIDNIYFSIIIPTANRSLDLNETLGKINQSTFRNFEVILIDNNSIDNTEEIAKKFGFVRYVKNDFNNFVIGARNQATKLAKGKVILFIDDDSFPNFFALESAYDVFENNNEVGIIACGIKNYETYKKDINSEVINNIRNNCREVFTWSGCGGFIRKTLYDKYGPWDESGINGFYENVTSLWALNESKKIMNYDNIFVYHKLSWGGEGGKLRGNDTMRYDEVYAHGYFILKYLDTKKMISKIIEMGSTVALSSIEQKTTIYLKSYFKLLKNVKYILRKRKIFPRYITDKIRLSFNFIGK